VRRSSAVHPPPLACPFRDGHLGGNDVPGRHSRFPSVEQGGIDSGGSSGNPERRTARRIIRGDPALGRERGHRPCLGAGRFVRLLSLSACKKGEYLVHGRLYGNPDKGIIPSSFRLWHADVYLVFAMQFSMFGDRILLIYFRSAADVGPYASFRDLSIGCAGFLTMPLLLASHPIIMAMWKEGQDKIEIENLMSRNIALLTLLFVPLLVMVDLCGPEIVGILFGAKYLVNKYVMLLVMLSCLSARSIMYITKRFGSDREDDGDRKNRFIYFAVKFDSEPFRDPLEWSYRSGFGRYPVPARVRFHRVAIRVGHSEGLSCIRVHGENRLLGCGR